MDCSLHRKPLEFICRASSCDMPLLCSECRKSHLMASKGDRNVHTAQIMPLRQAFEEAERNIKGNLINLQDMIKPFQNEEQIFVKIQQQKRQLLTQRDQIIRRVTDVFNRQIADLEGRNKQTMAQNKQQIPFEQIKMRISKLEEMQRMFKLDANKLRQSLSHSEQNYINQLRKNSSMLSSMKIQTNQYFIYDTIKHDFFLSNLELKRKTLNNKLLQKVQNQSDLYFLIDDYKQGNYLHYFSAGQNLLRVFDLQTTKWKEIRFQGGNIPSYGATLYEYKTGRFYTIGGQVGYQKTNSIIWYSKLEGWKSANMSVARSSAMATILYDKSGNHYILIAGGMGNDKRHLKFCEIFNPSTGLCIEIAPLNFAVTSGALVTFNDSIVFRIGGLGEFKQNVASICQISQKCDLSRCLQILQQGKMEDLRLTHRWTYMDIQVVNQQSIKKFNLFYAHQAAIQINPNDILIFGGMSHNSVGVNETYILEVQSIKNKQNNQSFRYYARWINEKPLVSAEGFISLRPIIYNKKVMSLQNISSGSNEYYEKEKRLIEFNMFDWREIENIVN